MRYCALALLLVGCVQDPRTTVTTPNQLGVVSLSLTETTEAGERVVELAGFDAADQRVALVHVRIGSVPQLAQLGPGDDFGSEVILSVAGGESMSSISRETKAITIAGFDPLTRSFLELPEAAEMLRTARFTVLATDPATDVAYGDYTQTCPQNTLLTMPTAYQCCYSGSGGSGAGNGKGYYGYYPATFHVRAEDGTANAGALVYRKRSTCGSCKSATCGACNGADCYYGPFGFAKAVMTLRSGSASSRTVQVFYGSEIWCDGIFTQNPPAPYWPNVNGTNASGQGCPGGATGAGSWDYF